jgi:hypothetical protein
MLDNGSSLLLLYTSLSTELQWCCGVWRGSGCRRVHGVAAGGLFSKTSLATTHHAREGTRPHPQPLPNRTTNGGGGVETGGWWYTLFTDDSTGQQCHTLHRLFCSAVLGAESERENKRLLRLFSVVGAEMLQTHPEPISSRLQFHRNLSYFYLSPVITASALHL